MAKKEVGRDLSKSHIIALVIISLSILFVFLAFSYVKNLSSNFKNCDDGTKNNQCSSFQPLFCYKGNLIKDTTFCGCPKNYSIKNNDCIEIKECIDGTLYNECSTNKPLFCSEGILINNISKCGCPEDKIVVGKDCLSRFSDGVIAQKLNYTLRGEDKTIVLGVSTKSKVYFANLSRSYSCNPKCPSSQALELRFIDNNQQKPDLVNLAEKIKSQTNNTEDQARIAISLVQQITYDKEGADSKNLTDRYPYEVLSSGQPHFEILFIRIPSEQKRGLLVEHSLYNVPNFFVRNCLYENPSS